MPGVLDLNLRPGLPGSALAPRHVGELVALASLVIGGRDEWQRLLGSDSGSTARLAEEAVAACPDTQVVVRDQSAAATAGPWGRAAAEFEVVPVRDPSGAGDAFAAGLLAGLLGGRSPLDSLELGGRCGRLQVGTEGDCDWRLEAAGETPEDRP